MLVDSCPDLFTKDDDGDDAPNYYHMECNIYVAVHNPHKHKVKYGL